MVMIPAELIQALVIEPPEILMTAVSSTVTLVNVPALNTAVALLPVTVRDVTSALPVTSNNAPVPETSTSVALALLIFRIPATSASVTLAFAVALTTPPERTFSSLMDPVYSGDEPLTVVSVACRVREPRLPTVTLLPIPPETRAEPPETTLTSSA